jgi:hypothetical protein
MDKNRFEQFKGITQLEPKHATQLVFTMDDLKWLVSQCEKAEQLESVLLKTEQKATEQIVKLEKENELLKERLKKANQARYNLGEGM